MAKYYLDSERWKGEDGLFIKYKDKTKTLGDICYDLKIDDDLLIEKTDIKNIDKAKSKPITQGTFATLLLGTTETTLSNYVTKKDSICSELSDKAYYKNSIHNKNISYLDSLKKLDIIDAIRVELSRVLYPNQNVLITRNYLCGIGDKITDFDYLKEAYQSDLDKESLLLDYLHSYCGINASLSWYWHAESLEDYKRGFKKIKCYIKDIERANILYQLDKKNKQIQFNPYSTIKTELKGFPKTVISDDSENLGVTHGGLPCYDYNAGKILKTYKVNLGDSTRIIDYVSFRYLENMIKDTTKDIAKSFMALYFQVLNIMP